MDGGAAQTDTGVKSGLAGRWPWLTGRRVRMAVIVAALLIAAVFLFRFLSVRAGYVSTADARIASDMVAVSTDISGRITVLAVSKGDRVEAGDVIFEIDRREAELTLAQYQAEADRLRAEIQREEMRANLSTSKAGSEVAARRAGTLSASASVAAAMSDFETAQSDFARTEDLFNRGRVTQAALDRAQNELDTAQQAVRRAEADADRALAEQRTASIAGEEVALIEYDLSVLRAALRQAEARVEAQQVVVDQHTIRSPIDGVVDEIFYDVGEHSLRGFRMALVHDPGAAWVSANIKETEIRHVQPGAGVKVQIDSYPGREFEGRVASINDSTLAEAALMPNPNANGVFTKITQRISVRIDLDAGDLALRPGTMATVRIEKTPPGEAG
ncbi:HlyD family secretion protein [Henriciella barbarensis]|uniref:HlyD family secretion protein n=1 Tax=Henriciella barbarensis TaxID=86342 RepID=A0A399QXE0_9PROT|nr:HlyD family secretion protein [Henriciella barbarensis]RIJ22177.1 HlyD family secretion protein [Henriciella barbarensis]